MDRVMYTVAFAAVLGVGVWALLMGPIGRAVGRWIEARTPNAQGQLMADLAELEVRLTRLERMLREAPSSRARRWPRVESD